MARLGVLSFSGIAIGLHLLLICSVFEIHFADPTVRGIDRTYGVERSAGDEAPSKRVVVFVADGLRADKAFGNGPEGTISMPFLRSKILTEGSFGVSHARVPTETRPGLVALFTGLYEDVSSFSTGWRLNPLDIDSVFNRSRHSWSWGGKSSVPMFQQGVVPGRMDAEYWPEEMEDYSKDATHLDTWVLDRVKSFFRHNATGASVETELRKDKTLFWIHFGGIDATGHSFRPHSKEYHRNVVYVDKCVEQITELFETFFTDHKTAFIFTSDHGMTDWGAHGDGHPDSTQTPFVSWGPGVSKPIRSQGRKAGGGWGLDEIMRNDIGQADVAVLIAYLLGINYPNNAIGGLPLAYIEGSSREKSNALFAKTQVVAEMYTAMEEQRRKSEIIFKPRHILSKENLTLKHRLDLIRRQIDNGQFDNAINSSQELHSQCLDGLRYLQTYNRLFLQVAVVLTLLGWSAFSIKGALDSHVVQSRYGVARHSAILRGACMLAFTLCIYLALCRKPFLYYLYALSPLLLLGDVLSQRQLFVQGARRLFTDVRSLKGIVGLLTALSVSTCFFIFSFFYRGLYTSALLTAQFWPLSFGFGFVRVNKMWTAAWVVTCQILSVLTLFSPLKSESLPLILCAGAMMAAIGAFYLRYQVEIYAWLRLVDPTAMPLNEKSKRVVGLQVVLVVVATLVTSWTVTVLRNGNGLRIENQVAGWTILVASLILPFTNDLYPNGHYFHGLMTLFLTFAPVFIILTISYEGIFYVAYWAMCVAWLHLEHAAYVHVHTTPDAPYEIRDWHLNRNFSKRSDSAEDSPSITKAFVSFEKPAMFYRQLIATDLRIALFFLFLFHVGFFSGGNEASLASFHVTAVYRLIPIYNPFTQGALLLLQVNLPFAIISIILEILNRRLGLAPGALFMIVLAINSLPITTFFFLVTDQGDWHDIGISISNFVIANLFCFWAALLHVISSLLVSGVELSLQGDFK